MLSLLPLPCGCVVDMTKLRPVDIDGARYIPCPWCWSALAQLDYCEWVAGLAYEQTPVWLQFAHTLVEVGGVVLEVVGRCQNCAAPLAREKCEEPFHLRVPREAVKVMRS